MRKSILYIENEHSWQKMIGAILSDYNLQIVSNYDEAVSIIEKSSGNSFDLVIINLNLEEDQCLDGVSLIEKLEDKIPCIVLTGRSTEAKGLFERYNVEQVLTKGIEDFFDRELLIREVKRVTEVKKSKWEKCRWKSTDGRVTINKGIIREILKGLGDDLPHPEFHSSYRDLLCIISHSQPDWIISHTVKLWECLWLEEEGLPYLPLIRILARMEMKGEMYEAYRDHVTHSIWVYLLGLFLFRESKIVRDSMLRIFPSVEDFLKAWKIAALFHDMGYTYDEGIDSEKREEDPENNYLVPLLEELAEFNNYPIGQYLKARELNLSEREEDKLAMLSNRYNPLRLTLDTFEEVPFRPTESVCKVLDAIEDKAITTQLGQKSNLKPIQSYYKLGKKEKPLPKERPRFRDHGVLSALILLHQFYRLKDSFQNLSGDSLPESIDRSAQDKLKKMIDEKSVDKCENVVKEAAFAIALHNINVDIWDIDIAKGEPYHLSLRDYRIDLTENPLAFLLAIADVLQCWNRPIRRFEPNINKLSVRDCDVRIEFNDKEIFWDIQPNKNGDQVINTAEEIKKMSKYLTVKGEKGDLNNLLKPGRP